MSSPVKHNHNRTWFDDECPVRTKTTTGSVSRPGGQGSHMASIPAPPVPLSQFGRAAQDIGLAGLLGGNLFGRLAMHPSVTEISDKGERGKLVNAAWRRYGTVTSLSLLAVVAGWAGARAEEAQPRRLGPGERRLAVAKDVL